MNEVPKVVPPKKFDTFCTLHLHPKPPKKVSVEKKLNEFLRRAVVTPCFFGRRSGAKVELKSFWRHFFDLGAMSFGAVWRQS